MDNQASRMANFGLTGFHQLSLFEIVFAPELLTEDYFRLPSRIFAEERTRKVEWHSMGMPGLLAEADIWKLAQDRKRWDLILRTPTSAD